MAIKLFISCCLALLFLSCGNDQNKIAEFRYYSVLDYPDGDTIWIDTIYQNPQLKNKNSLSSLIHSIDSALSISRDSVHFRNVVLKPKSELHFKDYEMVKYYAGLEIKQGTLSFYGIHLRNFGTVYWRWLDGHKALIIKEKVGNNSTSEDLRELGNYLNELIYTIPKSDSIIIDTEGGIEDSFDLQLDSTLFKPKNN